MSAAIRIKPKNITSTKMLKHTGSTLEISTRPGSGRPRRRAKAARIRYQITMATCPPSSGSSGSMLKMPTKMFSDAISSSTKLTLYCQP
jgi:hypothetical protein